MASTITAADLTVTLTEAITLNGYDQGSKNTKTISSIAEISKRIMTITTNEATIVNMSGAVASAGHFNDSFVKYMRFTNLDDTNFVTLTFRNDDDDEVAIKLDAGNSFMWFADNSGGMVDVMNAIDASAGGAASDTALGSMEVIMADANTGNCDLEVLIAST
jgi:hypothetical protein